MEKLEGRSTAQLGGRCAPTGVEGSPGYTLFLREGCGCCQGRGCLCARGPHPGDKPGPQRRRPPGGAMTRGGQEEGGSGWGSSYLSTGRCRRVSARDPQRRLGCSTRERRRRPGFCNCCGPRRLSEGTGRSARGAPRPQRPDITRADPPRPPLPPRPPDPPAGSAAPGPLRTASQLRHGAPPEATRRSPR